MSTRSEPLHPWSLKRLLARIAQEWAQEKSIFSLAWRRFWQADPDVDLRAVIGGRRVATPVEPAAGPHTQMAQNIALAKQMKAAKVRDLDGWRAHALKLAQAAGSASATARAAAILAAPAGHERYTATVVHDRLRVVDRDLGMFDCAAGAACGNCVTFCPERGAPWQVKPRLYTDAAVWEARGRDGFLQGSDVATGVAVATPQLESFTRRLGWLVDGC